MKDTRIESAWLNVTWWLTRTRRQDRRGLLHDLPAREQRETTTTTHPKKQRRRGKTPHSKPNFLKKGENKQRRDRRRGEEKGSPQKNEKKKDKKKQKEKKENTQTQNGTSFLSKRKKKCGTQKTGCRQLISTLKNHDSTFIQWKKVDDVILGRNVSIQKEGSFSGNPNKDIFEEIVKKPPFIQETKKNGIPSENSLKMGRKTSKKWRKNVIFVVSER